MANSTLQGWSAGALVMLAVAACGGADRDGLFQRGPPGSSEPNGHGDGGAAALDGSSGTGGVPALDADGSALDATGNLGGAEGAAPPDAGGETNEGSVPLTPKPGSCEKVCGTQSPDQSCYCDALCEGYGDCCSDFSVVCPNPLPPGSGCTKAHCGTDSPSVNEAGVACYCDPDCSKYGDCCGNVAQICSP